MTILFPEGPADAWPTISVFLDQLSHAHWKTIRGVTVDPVDPEAYLSCQPLRVHLVGLDKIVGGDFADQAQQMQWTCLLTGEKNAAVDLQAGAQGRSKAVSFTQSFWADQLAGTVQHAKSLFAKSAETYEIRLLQIPALNAGTIWLKGAREDVFIPISNTPAVDPGFTGRILGEAVRMRALYTQAAKDRPNGPPPGF